MILAAAIFAAAATAAPAPVSFDAARHSVVFTATETDCGADAQLEFLFVGPDSDRGYEALFVTDAKVSEIAAAFDKAGIPRGRPLDQAAARVWPVGERVSIEPALSTLVKDSEEGAPNSIVYAGGTRGAGGVPEAETNMPSAVFALYNCPQSLLQIDDNLGQSETYGRFTPAKKPVKGKRRVFTVTWNGTNSFETMTLELSPGNPEQIKANINATFPDSKILKIDRNRRGYEVKLNNGLEVEYSPSFQVIDIDD